MFEMSVKLLLPLERQREVGDAAAVDQHQRVVGAKAAQVDLLRAGREVGAGEALLALRLAAVLGDRAQHVRARSDSRCEDILEVMVVTGAGPSTCARGMREPRTTMSSPSESSSCASAGVAARQALTKQQVRKATAEARRKSVIEKSPCSERGEVALSRPARFVHVTKDSGKFQHHNVDLGIHIA